MNAIQGICFTSTLSIQLNTEKDKSAERGTKQRTQFFMIVLYKHLAGVVQKQRKNKIESSVELYFQLLCLVKHCSSLLSFFTSFFLPVL